MKFSLKTKLRLGLIFIFGLTLIIAVSSHFYLQNIVRQTKDIAKSNYETLDFVEQMRDALDFDGATDTADWQRYEQYLIKQEHNVTETGEAEATDILRGASETYKQTKSDTSHRQIATQLTKINALNRAAILRKNAASIQSTEDAAFGLAILSAVCILVAFSFLFNFPDYIANPVVRLKEGILKIADGNYTERIDLSSKDEFGESAAAFNKMAHRLDEYERTTLAKVMREKQRIETAIALFSEAVIGLDGERKILFINALAEKLLGVQKEKVLDKPAAEVARQNDLLRTLLNKTNNEPMRIFADNKESYFTKEVAQITDADTQRAAGEFIILKNITLFEEQKAKGISHSAAAFHDVKKHLTTIDKSLTHLETDANDAQRAFLTLLKTENSDFLQHIEVQLLSH